eukprot:1142695-Pelagomonas_calceolata.AAC.6
MPHCDTSALCVAADPGWRAREGKRALLLWFCHHLADSHCQGCHLPADSKAGEWTYTSVLFAACKRPGFYASAWEQHVDTQAYQHAKAHAVNMHTYTTVARCSHHTFRHASQSKLHLHQYLFTAKSTQGTHLQ